MGAALVASLVLLQGFASTVHARDPRRQTVRPEPLPRQAELTRQEYATKAVAQVRRSLFYPEQARRYGHTGEAVVRIALNAEGGVLSAVIARSSGHSALDQAAISAVLRASPFPPTPVGIPNPMTIEVEIGFGLRER